MKLYEPTLIVTFYFASAQSETLTILEDEIVKNSFSFNEQLLNGLESSSNRVSLKIKRGCPVIEKILSYQTDAVVKLSAKKTPDGSTQRLFTGYLSDNYTWKVNTDGEQEFQITIEDVGTKLLGKAFLTMSAPSLYNLTGMVFSGTNSIVQQICDRAGVTIKDGQLSENEITTVINSNIDKNMTCKELLSGILLECGYAYYFDNYGKLCLYKIDVESVEDIPILDRDNLWVVSGNAITLNKKVRQYKQVNVNYDEYESRSGVLVYKDVTVEDSSQNPPDCYIILSPGEYYPVPLLEVTTIQDMQALQPNQTEIGDYVRVTSLTPPKVYQVVELGTPGADYTGTYFSFVESSVEEVSFVEADDIDRGHEIISISNVVGHVVNTGSVTASITQRGAKNIAVVLHNTGSSDAVVTTLEAHADIVDIRAKCIIVAGESTGPGSELSENVYSVETKYIHTKDYAQTYANLLVSYYKYCNYTYSFFAKQDISLGSLVHVDDNAFSGLSVDLLLTNRTYNDSTSIYQYTGVAVSPFNLDDSVRNQQTLVPDKVGVPGPPGPMGEGLGDIQYRYATSSDQETQPSSGSYGPDIPLLDADTNRVLWVKTILIYTDGHTEEEVSIGAIYGDPGDPGESGDTVTFEYALTYNGVQPTEDDWSDERDIGWYVGYCYWTRFKFTDSEGTVVDHSQPFVDSSMNDIMSSLASFEISSDILAYERDERSNESLEITLTASSRKYYIPTYNWSINGTSMTGDTILLQYTKKTAPVNISVVCTLTSVVNGVSYTVTKNFIITSVDKTERNINYGILTSEPTSGTFIDGDSFVLQDDGDYLPYVYDSTNGWTEITNVALYPTQIAQVRDVILANGVNIPETSTAIYAYFKILSAQQAQIDTISSSEIILQEGGVIRSTNYSEDSEGNPLSGFKLDSEGNSAFVQSRVVNSIVSGSFSSEPLETQSQMAGSEITGELDLTQNYYSDRDLMNFVISKIGYNATEGCEGYYQTVPGTQSYATIHHVRTMSDTYRTERKTLDINNNITSSTTIGNTLPIDCDNVEITGTPLVKSLNEVAWTGSVSATTQFSTDNVNWNNFYNSISTPGTEGQNIYARQVFNLPQINYVTPTSWTNGDGCNMVSSVAYGNGYFIAVGGNTNVDGYIYRSTDGLNWSVVKERHGDEGQWIDVCYGNGTWVVTGFTQGGGSASAIWTSTDNGSTWTRRFTAPTIDGWQQQVMYVCYGDGKFRTSGRSSYYRENASYVSTDGGMTWTRDGSHSGRIAYGNNVFVSLGSSGVGLSNASGWPTGYITYCNNRFVLTTNNANTNHQDKVYSSTDGSSWTLVYDVTSSTSYASQRNIVYANGYYFYSFDNKLLYSTDLQNWLDADNHYGYLLSVPGKGVFNVLSSASYKCAERTYQDSDWTISTVGKLQITYDYSSVSSGVTLYDISDNVIANYNVSSNFRRNNCDITQLGRWDYHWSYNSKAYCRFKRFVRNGATVSSFDARSYVDNTTFSVNYIYRNSETESLYIDNDRTVSYNSAKVTIGGIDYYYNVKWNGTTFQMFLNGRPIASFSIYDYFRRSGTFNIQMTPNAQEDGVLVKDVLPKEDSRYSLGKFGREFAEAYIDSVTGNLTGNVTGSVDATGDGARIDGPTYGTHYGSVDATGSGESITGDTYGTHHGDVDGNARTSTRWTQGISIRIVNNTTSSGDYAGPECQDINFGPDTFSFDVKLPKKIYGAVWN